MEVLRSKNNLGPSTNLLRWLYKNLRGNWKGNIFFNAYNANVKKNMYPLFFFVIWTSREIMKFCQKKTSYLTEIVAPLLGSEEG